MSKQTISTSCSPSPPDYHRLKDEYHRLKDEILNKEVKKFQQQYPTVTSGDLQTFVLAWQLGWQAAMSIANK